MSEAFTKMREELARMRSEDVPRYGIYAKTGTGTEIALFTWRGSPEFGIMKAKSEAHDFGMFDLYDFRAEKL